MMFSGSSLLDDMKTGDIQRRKMGVSINIPSEGKRKHDFTVAIHRTAAAAGSPGPLAGVSGTEILTSLDWIVLCCKGCLWHGRCVVAF